MLIEKKLHEIGVSFKTSSKIMVVPTRTENGYARADVCYATNVHVCVGIITVHFFCGTDRKARLKFVNW